jgi:uncharacterized protein (TIGR00369 family)
MMPHSHKGHFMTLDTNRPSGAFTDLIGYRLIKHDKGYCELELKVEAKHLNRLGVPHGGNLAALIDTAAGIAIALAQGPDKVLPAVTLSLSMQFLGQAKVGDTLIATGRHVGGGRTIAYGTAEIKTVAGAPVARGDGTFRYVAPK